MGHYCGQGERQAERAKLLEQKVRETMHDEAVDLRTLLLLIDDVQRLGLKPRFHDDIRRALDRYISRARPGCNNKENTLFTASLGFRLLRQHGYDVSQDIFEKFTGNLVNKLGSDIEGMLSLYEASHFAFEEEQILEEAKVFTPEHLRGFKSDNNFGKNNLRDQVARSLDIPLHRRMQWQEARWYIDAYSKKKDKNHEMLELAILNFNAVQSVLQKDLQSMSRWWNESLGIGTKLSFARDRLMECFFLAVGMAFEPQLISTREAITKAFSLVTVIDDVYDVYGTLDELELFTDAVERWDIDAVSTLPHYMKICFLALYNTVNEMAYETLKDHGENAVPLLRKAWTDMCKAFLQEARWTHNKINPTSNEYIDNGWKSVSGVVLLIHAYFCCSLNITVDAIDALENFHDLLKWSSVIFRLTNDLATSSAELANGETANAIICHMKETGASEESARLHIDEIIDLAWKKMNKSVFYCSTFENQFINIAFDLARMSHYMYHNGDSLGAPDMTLKNDIRSLLIEPTHPMY